MSSKNSICILVKGYENIGGYHIEIKNEDYANKINSNKIIKKDEMELNKYSINPHATDFEAMIKSLKKIKNLEDDSALDDLSISIYTTYEENYMAAHKVAASKFNKNVPTETTEQYIKDYMKKLTDLKDELKCQSRQHGNKIKIYYVPDNFENKIGELKDWLTRHKKNS